MFHNPALLVPLFLVSQLRSGTTYEEIIASDIACMNYADSSITTTTFTAPLNGTIEGVKLVYYNGTINCTNSPYPCNNTNGSPNHFTCCATDHSLEVQLLQVTNINQNSSEIYGMTVYPNDETQGLDDGIRALSLTLDYLSGDTCIAEDDGNDCKYIYYQISDFNPTNDTLTLLYENQNVTDTDRYMLQSCKAFCNQYPSVDKMGTVCYNVYFLYSNIHFNHTDRYVTVYDEDYTRTWHEALLFCETFFRTSLASIHNETQRRHLWNSFYITTEGNNRHRSWIGFNNLNESDPYAYKWSDGTGGVGIDENFDMWFGDEPNGENEECVIVRYQNTELWFYDYPCDDEFHQFACNQFGPTISPTMVPTLLPSLGPTYGPSYDPTGQPTILPSVFPTIYPSQYPSILPSMFPTITQSTKTLITTDIMTNTNDTISGSNVDSVPTNNANSVNTTANNRKNNKRNNEILVFGLPLLALIQIIILATVTMIMLLLCIWARNKCKEKKRQKEKENEFGSVVNRINDNNNNKYEPQRHTHAFDNGDQVRGRLPPPPFKTPGGSGDNFDIDIVYNEGIDYDALDVARGENPHSRGQSMQSLSQKEGQLVRAETGVDEDNKNNNNNDNNINDDDRDDDNIKDIDVVNNGNNNNNNNNNNENSSVNNNDGYGPGLGIISANSIDTLDGDDDDIEIVNIFKETHEFDQPKGEEISEKKKEDNENSELSKTLHNEAYISEDIIMDDIVEHMDTNQ